MSVAIPQYTASGEAHGLINILTNSVENNDFKHMKPDVKVKLEKEKKEDSRVVKAEYLNSRGKHERLTKPYCRYAGDPIQIWHLIPGRVYEIPMGFIKEVNGNRMPKRSGLLEVDGEKVTKDGSPLAKDEEGEWIHKLIPVGF
jgi:hypothetical protein